MEIKNIFMDIALLQLPRILGFLDDDPGSGTFGCFDRYYWHYKILDFPNSRFQEAALVLSLAYSVNDPDNPFFNSDLVKKWAIAGIDFWAKARHRDGSTDESYPFERHFCATAFSLYAVTETLLLLKEKSRNDLRSTGDFIIRHNNPDVANQTACAALALYNLYLLTGESKYKNGFEDKLKFLLRMQTEEGVFVEYGGFDAGYDSITVSLLAALYKKCKITEIKNAALRCIRHMAPIIGEDGYFSPEKMSRKTQFLYPYGFAVFDPEILGRIEKGFRENTILNPSWLDDRYCIQLTASCLMTHQETRRK